MLLTIDLSTVNTNSTLEGTGPSTDIMTEIVTEIVNSTTMITSSLATLNVPPTTVGRCKCLISAAQTPHIHHWDAIILYAVVYNILYRVT